ncbi:Uncharacterised protein [Mycobacteroides abscessus subsp. abscessus]|nr:Uncharacterised protein [Mycobacteroides abscessus subsp. abscessus]
MFSVSRFLGSGFGLPLRSFETLPVSVSSGCSTVMVQ